jgi:hypothetical protein
MLRRKAKISTTPAKAGAHLSATRTVQAWAPTFVGVVKGEADLLGCRSSLPNRSMLNT